MAQEQRTKEAVRSESQRVQEHAQPVPRAKTPEPVARAKTPPPPSFPVGQAPKSDTDSKPKSSPPIPTKSKARPAPATLAKQKSFTVRTFSQLHSCDRSELEF